MKAVFYVIDRTPDGLRVDTRQLAWDQLNEDQRRAAAVLKAALCASPVSRDGAECRQFVDIENVGYGGITCTSASGPILYLDPQNKVT